MAILICICAVSSLMSCGKRSPLEAGPMLQNVSTGGFSVVWWQAETGRPQLCVRDSSGEVTKVEARREGRRCEASVSRLKEAEPYTYWIEHDGRVLSENRMWRVRPAKRRCETFSFLVFGDSGSGKRRQYALARTMNRHEADFILHVGDLLYGHKDWADYTRAFFRPYAALLSRIPLYPVLGNHDVMGDGGAAFLGTFSVPDNGPASLGKGRCYWFDYGNARIVGLDSNLPEATLRDTVAPWLRSALAGSHADWRFVFFHHPPYTGETYAPDPRIQRALVPAFHESHVDMVFCGHAHCYERTVPLRDGSPSPQGVTYITSGAGGKSLRPRKLHPMAYMAATNALHDSVTVVTVSGDTLQLKQIGDDNQVLDQVTLHKTFNDGAQLSEGRRVDI